MWRTDRSQQDALLHAVENRVLVLVGATTENPFFEVNSALISRSRVVELHSLTDGEIAQLVRRALADERGLAGRYALADDALSAIVLLAGGDGRASLTTLELASQMVAPGTPEKPALISVDVVQRATPHRALAYDKNKDMHYDVISAFIKSMRGSDPDAALYWLARMIDGGEDPKFIARRMMIQASEDVGNADPQAFLIAEAAFKSARRRYISRSLRRATLRRRGSTRRSPRCGMGPRARCPITCAIGIARAPRTTEPTNIPTIIPKGGSISATFPMAWSAAASIIQASGVGKLTARMPPPAIARRCSTARRETVPQQAIVLRRKVAPRQAIPREEKGATRLLLLLKGSSPSRAKCLRTLPPKRHTRWMSLLPRPKPMNSR